MSQGIIDAHKDILISSLKQIYADGVVCKTGARTSNGRGGFISAAGVEIPAFVKKEDDYETLAKKNIPPDMALIYVLSTIGEEVQEGWSITYKGRSYLIKGVKLDPVETAFECKCEDHAA